MIKVISDFSMFKVNTALTGLAKSTFANLFGKTHRFIMSNGEVSPENGIYWQCGDSLAYTMAHNAFTVTGNFTTATDATSEAAIRLYGLTASGGFPKEGIYQFGVRLKRSGSSVPTASPFHYSVTGGGKFRPTASTASTDVYVELVVDYVNSTIVLFYDGIEVWNLPSGTTIDTVTEFMIGSIYYTDTPNPFMSGGNTRMVFSDFYCANYSTKPSTGYPVFGSVTVLNAGLTTGDSGLQAALNSTYDIDVEKAPDGYKIAAGGVDLGNGGFGTVSGSVIAVAATVSACKEALSPSASLKMTIKESGVEKASIIGGSLTNPTADYPVRGQPMAVYCNSDGTPITGVDLNTITVNLSPTKPRV